MSRSLLRPLLLALLPLAVSCTDSTDIEITEIDADGAVAGFVFLDVDGDGALSAADTPREDLRVVLSTGRGTEFRDAVTDSAGTFFIFDVPAGLYTLSIPPSALGDSLGLTAPDGAALAIERNDTARVELGVSFPSILVAEIDDSPVDRKVFTSGIALNSRLPFGDGRVHLRGENGALRAINVERVSLTPGDSVRLLGRTARDGGRTVLRDVTATVLVEQATIPPAEGDHDGDRGPGRRGTTGRGAGPGPQRVHHRHRHHRGGGLPLHRQ